MNGMLRLQAFFMGLIFVAAPCWAAEQKTGELLHIDLPPGWMVGSSQRQGTTQLIEYIPKGQTLPEWKEMITVKTFRGASLAPEEMLSNAIHLTQKACTTSRQIKGIKSSTVNGYPAAEVVLICGENPYTHRAEITLYKAIQGRQALYLLQRAWSRAPFDARITLINSSLLQEGRAFLGRAFLCDTRDRERPCPEMKN
jgi:hypothetical protein